VVPVLHADRLTKTVGEGRAARRVLDGVNLAVEADEVVAVLGRSGSGRSTLLHRLGGLDSPVGRQASRESVVTGLASS
jgi:ABC-type lipoprotein export system ATPase subunit